MAKSSTRNSRTRSRRWPYAVLVLFVILAFAYWYYRVPLNGYAGAGTAYSARVACSCRFVAGRDLDSCEDDLMPGMEMVFLSADEDARSVTARVPLLASDTARYREGYGCVLESWDE